MNNQRLMKRMQAVSRILGAIILIFTIFGFIQTRQASAELPESSVIYEEDNANIKFIKYGYAQNNGMHYIVWSNGCHSTNELYSNYDRYIKLSTSTDGINWETSNILESPYGSINHVIAIDTQGYIHLAYNEGVSTGTYGVSGWNLIYATNKYGAWSTTTLTTGSSYSYYSPSALISKNSDEIHLFYNKNGWYRYNAPLYEKILNNSNWSEATLISNIDVGSDPDDLENILVDHEIVDDKIILYLSSGRYQLVYHGAAEYTNKVYKLTESEDGYITEELPISTPKFDYDNGDFIYVSEDWQSFYFNDNLVDTISGVQDQRSSVFYDQCSAKIIFTTMLEDEDQYTSYLYQYDNTAKGYIRTDTFIGECILINGLIFNKLNTENPKQFLVYHFSNSNEQETILSDATPDTTISAEASAIVYGSSATNQVTVASGANATLVNFSGSNAIIIQSNSCLFSVSRSGATVTFQGEDGTVLKIPATNSVQTISFNDQTLTLSIYNNQVMLDDQVVGLDNAPISIDTPDNFFVSTNINPDLGFKGDDFVFTAITNESVDFVDLTIDGENYVKKMDNGDGNGKNWSVTKENMGAAGNRQVQFIARDSSGQELFKSSITVLPVLVKDEHISININPSSGLAGDTFTFTAITEEEVDTVNIVIDQDSENPKKMKSENGTVWKYERSMSGAGVREIDFIAKDSYGNELFRNSTILPIISKVGNEIAHAAETAVGELSGLVQSNCYDPDTSYPNFSPIFMNAINAYLNNTQEERFNAVINTLISVYDETKSRAIYDQIIYIDSNGSLISPSSSCHAQQMLEVQKQCKEWVDSMATSNGGRSISYENTSTTLTVKNAIEGKAVYLSNPHAAIIIDVKRNENNEAMSITIAESNWASEWEHPTGQIPWNRTIGSRQIPSNEFSSWNIANIDTN